MAGKRGKNLPTDVKIRIITLLACYERPSVIKRMIKEEFGLDINATTIIYYDPDTAHTQVAVKYVKLFRDTRERFAKQHSRIPITNKTYRAAKLQRVLDIEEERENTVGMRDTLKQAAEEEGGAYTNKRELSGPNGVPLGPTRIDVNFVRPGEQAPADTSTVTPGDGQG